MGRESKKIGLIYLQAYLSVLWLAKLDVKNMKFQFLRIFTVAFLLFLTPAGVLTLWDLFPNHTGHSLTLT